MQFVATARGDPAARSAVTQGGTDAACHVLCLCDVFWTHEFPEIPSAEIAHFGGNQLAFAIAIRLTFLPAIRRGCSSGRTRCLTLRIPGRVDVLAVRVVCVWHDLLLHAPCIQPIGVEQGIEACGVFLAPRTNRAERHAAMFGRDCIGGGYRRKRQRRLAGTQTQAIVTQMRHEAGDTGTGACIAAGKAGDPAHAACPAMR